MFVGPVTPLLCSVLVTTVVFPGAVRPYIPVSGDDGVVSASVLHEVGRAAAGSSTVVEVETSASEALSVVTHSVVESVVDVGPPAVQSPVEQLTSVVAGRSHSAVVDALGPEFEQLSVASLSPGPVDICVDTAATAVGACVSFAAGRVVLADRTESRFYVLNEVIGHVKPCMFCSLPR